MVQVKNNLAFAKKKISLKGNSEYKVRTLFEMENIRINCSNPWEVKVYNQGFYDRFWHNHLLGLCESVVDEWIGVDDFAELIFRLFRNRVVWEFPIPVRLMLKVFMTQKFNLQFMRPDNISEVQYDLPPILFESFLTSKSLGDKGYGYSPYTCGYWKGLDINDPYNLDQAQIQKLELICKKLRLEDLPPGSEVLDFGCGWGSLARYIADHYPHLKVVCVNISKQQIEYTRKLCAGLSVKVYDHNILTTGNPIPNFEGDGPGEFQVIIALGSFEHMGQKNHRKFFQIMKNQIKPNGLMLIQTISLSHDSPIPEEFIWDYIFPEMECSTPGQVLMASQGNHWNPLWKILDFHSFQVDGNHYDATLKAWNYFFRKNWDSIKQEFGKQCPQIKDLDRFYRIWTTYLSLCEGGYRAKAYPQLIQYVFGPEENMHYDIVR